MSGPAGRRSTAARKGGIRERKKAGAFERVNAYALMLWFALLAVTVLRRCFTEATEERTTDVRQTGVQTSRPSLVGRS
jgi:hypothetical protein